MKRKVKGESSNSKNNLGFPRLCDVADYLKTRNGRQYDNWREACQDVSQKLGFQVTQSNIETATERVPEFSGGAVKPSGRVNNLLAPRVAELEAQVRDLLERVDAWEAWLGTGT